MLNIMRGIIRRPVKCVIYGVEGIGKSTLASKMPDPLYLDTEGGTDKLAVNRVKPQCWEELLAIVREVANTPNICKTLVLDTADWAESFAQQNVCRRNDAKTIEMISYGRGYVLVANEFKVLLAGLNRCIEAGINVVIIAHAAATKFTRPDVMESYNRYELKLTKHVAPLLKEWCDMLLFCNHDDYVVNGEKNGPKKPQGGDHVMYATYDPAFDAKNRFGLPKKMTLDYDNIRRIFDQTDTPTNTNACNDPTPLEQLRSMMVDASISDDEIKGFAASQGYAQPDQPIDTYPDDLIYWIITNWSEITNHLRSK